VTELIGRVTPADRLRSDYLAIPFEVPAGRAALHVGFTYEGAMSADVRTGGNTIDLGLFEPGSLGFGSPAFRGWSGSERNDVWLAPEAATPGYRPGPIVAGTWHVVLGLYQVANDGAPYRLTIETHRALPPGVSDLATRATQVTFYSGGEKGRSLGPLWLRGDLHCHTLHSDGAEEPATLVGEALRLGLDFLAITDHNTDSHHGHVVSTAGDDTIVLLKAEEVTTYYGHSNAWGLGGWVDFRNRTAEDMRRSFDEVHRQGGLVSVNHPFGGTSPWELGDELAAEADTIEVWNGPWSPDERDAIDWWARLLASGARPTAVGGSDCHSFRRRAGQALGGPTTWVRAATRDREGVTDGIRAGRVVITARPDTPRPDMTAGAVRRATPAPSLGSLAPVGPGDTLDVRPGDVIEIATELDGDDTGLSVRILSDGGLEASGPPRSTFHISAGGHRFLRLELDDADGSVVALTNPIHLREA
jgi:hypothetical protein